MTTGNQSVEDNLLRFFIKNLSQMNFHHTNLPIPDKLAEFAEMQRRVTLLHHEKIEKIVEAIKILDKDMKQIIENFVEAIKIIDKDMKRIVEEQTTMRRWSIGIGIGGLILGVGIGVGVALLMRKRS
jgi:hypothetical protein